MPYKNYCIHQYHIVRIKYVPSNYGGVGGRLDNDATSVKWINGPNLSILTRVAAVVNFQSWQLAHVDKRGGRFACIHK